MKKTVSVFLSLSLLLLLFGCSAKKQEENIPIIPTSFKAKIEISYNELKITSEIVMKGFNYFSMDFLSPTLFEPLKLVIENDNCRLIYNDISYEMSSADFPAEAFGKQLAECINALSNPDNLEIKKQDSGDWLYSGTISVGRFSAVQDGKTGYIKAVEIPDINFYVTVNEFTLIEKGS